MRNICILLTLIATAILNYSFHNLSEKKIPIYIEEYDFFFTPQKAACNDTVRRNLGNGKEIRIFLLDCKGKMSVECYKANKKIEQGEYVNSLDLLKKYSYGVSGVTGKRKISVHEYYQPLRSGEWLFFNSRGAVIDKKNYKDGILQE